MNSITNFSIYFLLICFLGIGVLLYLALFKLVFKFKWNIDYFLMRDKMCNKNSWTKFEIESYRYNIYAFFYNVYWYSYLNTSAHDISDKYVSYSFKTIKDSYATTYYIFIVYVAILMFGLIFFLLWKGTQLAWLVYFMLLIVFVIYFIVNGIIKSNFDKMTSMLQSQNNALFRYHAVYKILNAIVLISDLKDIPVEYSYYKLNEDKQTFEHILESNIAACEYLSNISKIKQVKLNVYENLDFMKYMVFDKMSPFYWKYFDNPYIRIPYKQTNQYDISENVYLSEVYLKRYSSIDYDNIGILFNEIPDIIKDIDNNIYVSIKDKIINHYPPYTQVYYPIISKFYQDINAQFSENNNLDTLDRVTYDRVAEILAQIEELLKTQQYNSIYNEINVLIHKKINEKAYSPFTVDNDDYIKFYLDNQDILFNSEFDANNDFEDVFNVIEDQSRYIYAYIVFFIFMFLMISHYFYKTINGPRYIYIMIALIILYLFYGYSQTLMIEI